MNVTPKRPYLLRAFYEWIVDNGMTPHILVDARSDRVIVPRQFVKDGNIVLNVSMIAANNLMMRNDEVTFSARFGGKAFSIWLPMSAVMAIYSKETQDGISFPADEYADAQEMAGQPAAVSKPALSLTTVSGNTGNDTEGAAEEQGDEPEPPKPSKPRPALRVVK